MLVITERFLYPNSDMFSHCNPSKQYCSFNEKLKIVSEHGDVFIMEGSFGRFPCHKSILSENPNNKNSTKEKLIMFNKSRIQQKKNINNQKSLF